MNTFVQRLLLAWMLVALAACESSPATAVVVSVKTDLVVGEELARLTYQVFRETADPETDLPVAEYTLDAQDLDMPFVVTRNHADTFLLSVEGFARGSTEPVVVYRERVSFQREVTLALRVFLARSCYRKQCTFAGLTCFGETRGNAAAGQCDAIAGPRVLEEVEQPGDESLWEPMPGTRALDGGAPTRPPSPSDGCSRPRDGGTCSRAQACCP